MENIDAIESLVSPVAEAEGCELVEVELAGKSGFWILRIFIDKEGGVTVEDCAAVSRQISLLIDAEDIIDEKYTLEVSSPGLTRPLKKPDHYKRAIGKLATVRLRQPVDDKRVIAGVITAVDEAFVTVITKETGEEIAIGFENISKANLEFED